MRVIFPQNPLNPKEADEPYQNEFFALEKLGKNCSLFDLELLEFGEFKSKPKIQDEEVILYRGWMLNPARYQIFEEKVIGCKASLLTSLNYYIKCHHIVSWYDQCSEFTAESKFFPDDNELEFNIQSLGWDSYFVKDYVKSNTAELGSIAKSVSEVLDIVSQIKEYRGEVEGGVTIRRVESYRESTEMRYFVFNGTVYSPDGTSLDIVSKIAKKIAAPFYSVDEVQRIDGEYRLVEIGDGQVSAKNRGLLKKL